VKFLDFIPRCIFRRGIFIALAVEPPAPNTAAATALVLIAVEAHEPLGLVLMMPFDQQVKL